MFEKTDSFKLISILFINLSFLLFIYQVKKYLLKWTFSVNLLFKACVFFNLKLNFKLKVVNKISVEFKRIYWEKMTSTVTLVFRRDTIWYSIRHLRSNLTCRPKNSFSMTHSSIDFRHIFLACSFFDTLYITVEFNFFLKTWPILIRCP